jgi:uncharacterized protein (TIGR02246 family)
MNEDEKAVREVIRTWHERTARGDIAGVLSLMEEDAMFLVTGKPPMSGRAEFEKGLQAILSHNRIESTASVEEVRVSGDLAYARTQLSVTVVPNNGSAPKSRQGSTLTIFRRVASGSWLLSRDANLLASTA